MEGESLEKRLIDQIGKTGEKMDISHYSIIEGNNVVPYIHAGNRMGVLVELNNDPSEINLNAGRDTAMQIAAMNPIALDEKSVPKATIDREIAVGKEQAIGEGKPAEMAEKIAMGRLNKFYKEYTLLNQDFVKDSSKSIAKMLSEAESGLTVKSFVRVALGS
jgi:elongation factor Ts